MALTKRCFIYPFGFDLKIGRGFFCPECIQLNLDWVVQGASLSRLLEKKAGRWSADEARANYRQDPLPDW